jgi:hypothetical protein
MCPSSGGRSRSTARSSSERAGSRTARARAHLERTVGSDPELQRLLDDVQARRVDPLSAVSEIMSRVFEVEDDAGGG